MNKKYAFFDLDHTLLPVDSCGLWAYFLFTKCGPEEEALTQKQKQYDEEYFHGQLDMEAFMDFEMAILHRFPRKELEVFREEYLRRFIKPKVTKEALDSFRNIKMPDIVPLWSRPRIVFRSNPSQNSFTWMI